MKIMAIIFLALGVVFVCLLYSGYVNREIKAKGWGVGVRIYSSLRSPGMYWFTFVQYLILACGSFAFALLLLFQ